MIRRRRPQREIAFSFDSFLDVVANVVGIILRLILVAWVGARSYKALVPPPPPPSYVAEAEALPEPEDPLTPELERQRRELGQMQAQLLEQMKQWEGVHQLTAAAAEELAGLTAKGRAADAERGRLAGAAGGPERGKLALSLAEVRERGRRVTDELEALRKAPSLKKTLRYRTPVSAPLQSEELLFECYRGRVTLIDVGALLEDARRGARSRADLLRTQFEFSDTTAAVGAFRLRYTVEREHGPLDGPGLLPGSGTFRCSISWEAVPVVPQRGEAADDALKSGSEFRRIADNLDPQQTAVTMWVYPDSFALYRRLRDYLHERDVVVAGRPLPDGFPIASNRHGSASRGQ
ncbi:MAG TPA: hypothetical protein VFE78_06225 [Gemmataceae bacterium]|jgi:hypothetical protein|nr:hypothetical protein [Gemmataceae bacterium]